MKRNKDLGFNTALCGVCAALAMVLMFLSSVIPTMTYALPAAAGALMAVIVIEVNKKWAVCTYAAVSALCLIMIPAKDASLIFVMFMGYYPILKSVLERKIKNRTACMAVKIAVFTAAVVGYYEVLVRVFADPELLDDSAELGKYGLWLLFAASEVIFVIYDLALSRLISVYFNWFRKKFLRRK